MKIINTIYFLVLTSTATFAQTVSITGTVNNQKGQPVPYAFVRDAQHNYATYADSTGTFLLKADPSSSLEATSVNYKKATIKIDNQTKVNIVLPDGAGNDGVSSLSAQSSDGKTITGSFMQNRQQLIAQTNPNNGSSTIVKEGFNQEPTRGSRYLYDEWVPGFGVSKKDSLVVETTNMYNFDKISGNLIYTNDGKSMAQVSASQIRTFSLFDKKGHAHVYENAPDINGKPFVEVLVSNPKYKIYKKIDTKLTRADFHTDGVLEMGHKYDEYVDVERYFFVGADGKPQSISLKKSTLKKLMGGDADAFIAAQGSRDVDDDYVKDLGDSLSK